MQSWPARLKHAQKLAQARKFELSIKELKALSEAYPAQPEIWFEFARIQFQAGQSSPAKEALAAGLKIAPGHPQGLLLKGMSALQSGKYSDAIRNLRKAIKALPGFALAHYHLGIAYGRSDQLEKGIQTLEKAVQLDPQQAPAFDELGRQLAQNGRPDEARTAFQRAIKADPTAAGGYLGLVRLNLQANQPEAAAQLLHHAIGKAGGRPELLDQLIDVYMLLRRFPEAFATAQRLTAIISSYQTLLKLGLTALAAREWGHAEQAFLAASALQPDGWEAHYNLGELLFAQGKLEEAKCRQERAIQAKPNDYKPFNAMALLLLHLNTDLDLAHSLLKNACKLAPDQPEPYYNLGLLLARQNQTKKAMSWVAEALTRCRPDHPIRPEAEKLLARLQK